EKATNEALIRNFDDIKARLEADRLLAERLQEQEREQFTIEERAKFLHDTIAAQRKFIAQQRSKAIRNKPPTKNQLRNQMMTYLKHVGNFKHSELKAKKFEEIQALYEKIKRSDEDFVAIGSKEDEEVVKEMNVKAENPIEKRKGTIRKMKSSRVIKKRKIQQSDDEPKDFLKVVDFESDSAQDVEVLEQRSFISSFSIVQTPEGEYIAVQRVNGHLRAFNTLDEVLHILNRQDLHHLHKLVVEYYKHIPPTELGLILLGDLATMMETTEERVHILELENGAMIHMLAEKRYPLTRELIQRMLEHKLEVQEETEDALNVIRFVMKQKEDLEKEEE
ncbi:hypothetical protein Tco_0050850, partial [Tanacetum coccineum]